MKTYEFETVLATAGRQQYNLLVEYYIKEKQPIVYSVYFDSLPIAWWDLPAAELRVISSAVESNCQYRKEIAVCEFFTNVETVSQSQTVLGLAARTVLNRKGDPDFQKELPKTLDNFKQWIEDNEPASKGVMGKAFKYFKEIEFEF